MKRFFLITILLLALTAVGLGVLDYLGYIRITWSPLIIAFTALAPILKLISNWFSKPEEKISQLKQIHANNAIKKISFNKPLIESKTDARDVKIAVMKQEILALRQQVKGLEDNMKKVDQEVDDLSDDQLSKRFVDLYGS